MSDVGIPSDKLHVVIEADLRDQRVGQTGAPSVRQQPRAQETGALPVPVQDFENWKPKHNIPEVVQQTNRPNHFTVVEIWKDAKAVAAHSMAAGTRRFRDALATATGALYDERKYRAVE